MNYPYDVVLVTGGAGFIGSHICSKLVELGAYVICLDDFSAGKVENVDHLSKYNNFEIIAMDVCDPDIKNVLSDVDVVFHNAASKKNICLNNPKRDLEVNSGGTLNLLLAAKEKKVRRFVHASTGSVYGKLASWPQDENHKLNPCSYYGVSKLAGEKYTKLFNDLFGIDTTILRYFHVYGPRQDYGEFGGVIAIFAHQMLNDLDITVFGDGTQQRTFTHVSDVVKANIEASMSDKAIGKIYNCASGIKVSINEVIEYMKEIIEIDKCNVKYDNWLVGDIKEFDVDNSLIINDLKINFMTDIRSGLKQTVESYKRESYK